MIVRFFLCDTKILNLATYQEGAKSAKPMLRELQQILDDSPSDDDDNVECHGDPQWVVIEYWRHP